jgi:diguanylate cyclase (GGDEF)-like protein/PAS domain S-box-containing protein
LRCPDRSHDEEGRLRTLAEYALDEERGLPSLNPIVDMAARLFDCPAAAVNMIGDDHVFLAASHGVGDCDMSRDVSFCAHAINQNEVMVIQDATLDPRFHDNPLVADGLIRFYAGVPICSPSGHALGALCVIDNEPHPGFTQQERTLLLEMAKLVTDKLELQRLEAAVTMRSTRFEAIAATSPNAVLSFDDAGRVTTANGAASTMFGRSKADLIGCHIDTLIAEEDRELVHSGIARVGAGGEPFTEGTPLNGLRHDGSSFPGELQWSRWYEGQRIHFGAIIQDMTEKRREHDALYRLANYDTLTGLPNRNFLHEQLAEMLKNGGSGSIVAIDLDRFTDINNTLGHAAGDAVLRIAAERIRAAVPETGFVARTGGDEFTTLLPEADPLALRRVADGIIAALAEPFVVDGHEFRLAGNCGLALAPHHGENAEELASSAQLALYHARTRGPGQCMLYTPNLRAEAAARRMYDAELHRAFERGEFCLFYQPQIELKSGIMTGAEALIRWQHPERGLLLPAAFLPALEGSVLASRVGAWVLEEACTQAAIWRRHHPSFRISVNLSGAQFRDGDLPLAVTAALRRHGLPAEALELEITENIILYQQERVLFQLQQLREIGVMLSFDDFGTGFASLNLLRTFPVTHIKIDKDFTQAMRVSRKDRVIVVGLIDIAQQLGLKVVAEGIESAADADFLSTHGCEKGQGYLFGRPAPAPLFEERFFDAGTGRLRA